MLEITLSEHYINLPYDLSGSRAKNRFRNEMLWGLKKMLDLYKNDIPFTVVFDYNCVIEVHKTDGFEFYHLKTQNNTDSYTLTKMLDNKSSGGSILEKLYLLRDDSQNQENDEIKIALVSKAPLNDGKKTYSNMEIVDLSSLNSKDVKDMKEKIKTELQLSKKINLKIK